MSTQYPIFYGHEMRPEADLSNANFAGCAFLDLDLRCAIFYKADVRGASFRDTNLEGANLTGVNLNGASFDRCDLDGANFYNADLEDTRFYKVSFKGAENILMISPFGSRGDNLIVVRHARRLMFKTGCFWGTANQLLTSANRKHGIGNPHTLQYRAAIHFAQVTFKQQRVIDNPPF